MVRLGGVGIVVGFSLGLMVTWIFGGFAELPPDKDQLIWTSLAGALCYFTIGLADDLFAQPPLPRLLGQVGVAMAVWSQGVRISNIDLPFNLPFSSGGLDHVLRLPPALSLVATVIWLAGITNAINWLDGLDGLAAGVSGIAAVALLSVSFSLQQPAAGLLAAALVFCATISTPPASSWVMGAPTSLALPWPRSALLGPPRASRASACCCPC
jgi:UDP-N-acetylmuramyl pentapeptide phosphotransferase/UDP-N-acetylglucosamine-1-phosphate transferase